MLDAGTVPSDIDEPTSMESMLSRPRSTARTREVDHRLPDR